jgi:PhnB protein
MARRTECKLEAAEDTTMTKSDDGVPEGASGVIPRLVCRDPGREIEFCVATFAAVERVRRPAPGGGVGHAMLTFGSAMVMIEAEWPSVPSKAPPADGSSPVVIYVYVKDVDEVVARARAKGGRVIREPENQFWGDRIAWVVDPEGHVWTIASRIEETTEEQRRGRWEREMEA